MGKGLFASPVHDAGALALCVSGQITHRRTAHQANVLMVSFAHCAAVDALQMRI